MITARQARAITYSNNEFSELEWIERQIIDACNGGRNMVGNLYDSNIKELRDLGYTVNILGIGSCIVTHVIKW